MTAPEQPDVPHKAAAGLLAAARTDPTLRGWAEQVQDALIELEQERDAGAVPDTGRPTGVIGAPAELAAAIRTDAELPDHLPTGDAIAHCAYLKARKALRTTIQVAAQALGDPAVPSPDTGQPAAGWPPTDGWADLPTPEDVAAEMSRQMTGSDTAARRESLVTTACRALDAIGTLREKGQTR
jgi:hypothetical protein